ncbi:MAG: S-methyl-5-thioribose-1-phosphate isomerase [Desulfuromonadaceae bacterium]|nr:S-methyl-5-thioribose-1-phosphate isomerase [Desulfuromonadaceae bacterium]
MSIKPILYQNGKCRMIDQRLLPAREEWRNYDDYRGIAEAIRTMVIRGAPAIGVAAAFGAAFGARDIEAAGFEEFYRKLEAICSVLAATRPTAVNLFWALERVKRFARHHREIPLSSIREGLLELAVKMADEDERTNRALARHGNTLISRRARILTHCNAGALATAGYGTALGVIRAAFESGKEISVYADETRPWLQGARLTAWELQRDGIPTTLICDNMAGHLMARGEVDCVIVGADRIAANGDTANKIGTYTLAVLCKEHHLPFYVAAPLSTIDYDLADGSLIPIEERGREEVIRHGGVELAPAGIAVRNPAFDVTPARLITAIITEAGIIRGNRSGDFLDPLKPFQKKNVADD